MEQLYFGLDSLSKPHSFSWYERTSSMRPSHPLPVWDCFGATLTAPRCAGNRQPSKHRRCRLGSSCRRGLQPSACANRRPAGCAGILHRHRCRLFDRPGLQIGCPYPRRCYRFGSMTQRTNSCQLEEQTEPGFAFEPSWFELMLSMHARVESRNERTSRLTGNDASRSATAQVRPLPRQRDLGAPTETELNLIALLHASPTGVACGKQNVRPRDGRPSVAEANSPARRIHSGQQQRAAWCAAARPMRQRGWMHAC